MEPKVAREAYSRTAKDGLVETVFGERMDEDRFVRYFAKGSGQYPVLIFVDERFSGYAWLNGVSDARAFAHFCFFKSIWGKRTKDIGKRLLDYWFAVPGQSEPLFRVLVGIVDAANRRAIRFVEGLGFTKLGEIPHLLRDGPAAVLYKTRY